MQDPLLLKTVSSRRRRRRPWQLETVMACEQLDSLGVLVAKDIGSLLGAEALSVCWGVETLLLFLLLRLTAFPQVLWLLPLLQSSDPR